MFVFNLLIVVSACLAIAFGLMAELFWFGIFKALTTCVLIFALVAHRQYFVKSKFWAFFSALLACLAGDIFLLNDTYFVAGLSAFLIAHLLFVRLFVLLGGWYFDAITFLALVLFGGWFYYYIEPTLGEFRLPVAVYSSVIIVMAWQGIGLASRSSAPRSGLIAFGAILFMFSDSMIALNKFVQPFELSTLVILSTYWLSLTLILNSVLSILRHKQEAN